MTERNGRRKRVIPKPYPGRLDGSGIREAFAHRMMYSIAKDEYTATDLDLYHALAYSVRDRLMERWFRTQDVYYRSDAKRVYYLSLEFLTGRALRNNILSLGSVEPFREALDQMGLELEDLETQEWDAGLGNGGLGRLAACFLDSAATLALPFYGYGIRYEYGIFRQRIRDGHQIEAPDNWLRYGNPWEIPRPDALFPVQFYGRTRSYVDETGLERFDWVDAETVYAMAYDTPIAGFRNDTVNSLRLWSAKSSREFDLSRFHSGDYVKAVEAKYDSENISKVLYPPDDSDKGKELRLKQQYFFVSATLQDVLRRFLKRPGRRWDELPEKVAVQLNDTHPTLAIPELMRILVDGERLAWDEAWGLTTRIFGYTNHTVLPEALECWSSDLFGRLLPRHLQIIEEIDRRHGVDVRSRFPGDEAKVERTAMVTVPKNGESRMLRMANLAFVGSRAVNGVSKIHTGILRATVFRDLDELFPGRLLNVTNGVTPRRWLLECNPRLASLVSEAIGDGWTTRLDELARLAPLAGDPSCRAKGRAATRESKRALEKWTRSVHGLKFDPDALCDCQVKRIHEYKRQLLNVLHVLALYLRIKDGVATVPRTVLFAGKAAPSYVMAKRIIKLIHEVGSLVNGDPATAGRLHVLFVPNYSVSAAEVIFPACELSEQISTAGTEASGTGVMKGALNGALTIGTLDGANIELRDEVGEENVFVFGRTASEIDELRAASASPSIFIQRNEELARVLEFLAHGPIEQASPGLFAPVVDLLTRSDRYFHAADFSSYVAAQESAARVFAEGDFAGMSIRTVAGSGRFSSDRAVAEYASSIWRAPAVPATRADALRAGGSKDPGSL